MTANSAGMTEKGCQSDFTFKPLHPDANQDPVIKTTKHPLSSFSLLHYVNRLCLLITLVGLGVILSPHSAYAACSNPVGVEGEQVFNSTYRNMQFCNGTDWIAMGYVRGPGIACAAPWGGTIDSGAEVIAFENATVPFGNVCNGETRTCNEGSLSGSFTNQTCTVSGPADTTPDPFDIPDIDSMFAGINITSRPTTASGIDAPAPVSISGDGSPEFKITSFGTWTTSGTITDGQEIFVRLTAPASGSRTATLNIGGVTDTITVTKINLPAAQTINSFITDSTLRTRLNTALGSGSQWYECGTPSIVTYMGTSCQGFASTIFVATFSGVPAQAGYYFDEDALNFVTDSWKNVGGFVFTSAPSRSGLYTASGASNNSGNINNVNTFRGHAISALYGGGSRCYYGGNGTWSAGWNLCDGTTGASGTYITPSPRSFKIYGRVTSSSSTCTLPWGGTINDGQSVTAYAQPSVPFGSSCSGQTRTCSGGALSGSFVHQNCFVQPPSSPYAWQTSAVWYTVSASNPQSGYPVQGARTPGTDCPTFGITSVSCSGPSTYPGQCGGSSSCWFCQSWICNNR